MDLGAAQLEARRRREECRAAEAAGNRFTRRLNERNVVPSARERTEERRRMEGIVSVPNDASYKPLEDSITTRSRDLKANDQYPQTQQLANEFLSDLSIDGVGFNYYQTQASCSRDFGFRDPTHESTFISSSRANFSEPNTNLQLGYTLTPSYTTPQSLPPAPASSQDTFPSEIVDPVTGRPRLGDLLKDYNTHVAKEIWDKPMTAWVRKVHRRDKALQKLMQIFHGTPRNVEWRKMVEASGVFGLFWRQLRHVDHTLIYAFVERWHPETNTFHLPFGEMTITLHDVLHISSLPIDGEAVSGFLTDLGIRKHATYLFGPWTDEEFHQILNDNGFKTAHLWDCMISFIHHDGSPQAIVSAWLLQFLAVTLFMDKSTHKIKAKFLCLIVDYARTGRLAWGTGSLAYLYRQLGKASRRDTTKIAGFIALLSRWISHYFPSFRTYKEDHTPLISQVRLREYREQIEHLRASDVIWFPYEKQIRSWNGPERISMYRGTIQCMNIVEPYHPDRVARQFGRVQDIPLDPIQPIRGVRPFTSKQYNLEFNDVEDRWERRHSDEAIRSTLRSASLTIVPWQDTKRYIYWYFTHCHPYALKESWAHQGASGEAPLALRRIQCHQHVGTRFAELLERGTVPNTIEISRLFQMFF